MFLALASCIEHEDEIEPLPDLDLNMRSGNLLVGAESLEDAISRWEYNLGSQNLLDSLREQHRENIKLHQEFMRAQDNGQIEEAQNLKDKILELEHKQKSTLDKIAFTESTRKDPSKDFEEWKSSHRPFHWFVEFPEAMQDGGFDVVLGNPPFISKKKVNEGTDEFPGYAYSGFETDSCPDIYAPCLERSANLIKSDGRFAMISPISLSSTKNFKIARTTLQDKFLTMWVQAFGLRPSSLFDVSVHPLILIGNRSGSREIYTTSLRRFTKEFRQYLFGTTRLCLSLRIDSLHSNWVLCGNENILSTIKGLDQQDSRIGNFISENGKFSLGLKRVQGVRFFPAFLIDPPAWEICGYEKYKRIKSNSEWHTFDSQEIRNAIFLFLAGTIGNTFWATVSDGFNITTSVVKWKPFSFDDPNTEISKLEELAQLISKVQIRNPIISKKIRLLCNFNLSKCRHITDLSDKVIFEILGYSNTHPYMLLANDWLVKSQDMWTTTSGQWPKHWTPTYGPWEEGMPE